MYVHPKLKLNRLVQVIIPKGIDLFARFGITAIRNSMYSGDNFIPQESKLDSIHRISRMDKDALDNELYEQFSNESNTDSSSGDSNV